MALQLLPDDVWGLCTSFAPLWLDHTVSLDVIVELSEFLGGTAEWSNVLPAFERFCRVGHLQGVEWVVGRFQLLDAEVGPGFAAACGQGHMHVAEWIVQTFTWHIADREIVDAFVAACGDGHLAVAQWIATKCPLTVDQALRHDGWAFCAACTDGHIEVAKWLHTTFMPSTPTATFFDICANGQLQVAQWLEETIGHDQNEEIQAFRFACANGHLSVAQWLADRFMLTPQNARIDNNGALRLACENGMVDVAQWLVDHFGLDIEDAKRAFGELVGVCETGQVAAADWILRTFPGFEVDIKVAFETAVERGHLAMVQWLASHINANGYDWRHFANSALTRAYNANHVDVAQWLVDNADITLWPGQGWAALVSLGFHGNVVAAQWLVDRFGLTAPMEKWSDAFSNACFCDHLEMAKWLVVWDGAMNEKEHRKTVYRNFVNCCALGQLEMADWLASSLTTADILANNIQPLREACVRAQTAMAMRLVSRFGLTAEQVCANDNFVFRDIFDRAPPETTRWLAERFDITPDGVDLLAAFKRALGGGDVDSCQWILGFAPSITAQIDVAETLREACMGGHLRLAKWLVKQCELTKADEKRIATFERFFATPRVARWLNDEFDLSPQSVLFSSF